MAGLYKMVKDKLGLVQLYTGNGKGKTSAALGAVLRALGHGLKAHIVFFMKGDVCYGEQEIMASLPGASFSRFGHREFVDPANVKPRDIEQAHLALHEARRVIHSGKYDLVVLDEVNIAVAWGLISVEDVLQAIRERPPGVEVILTGRYAPPQLIEAADLVTEMVEVKHPYSQGLLAREGIEY